MLFLLPFVLLLLSGSGNALPTCGTIPTSSTIPTEPPSNTTAATKATNTTTPTNTPKSTNPNNITAPPIIANTTSNSGLTPNGLKAGIAGGQSYSFMQPYLGWWYDWSPNPPQNGKPIAAPMLWGLGRTSDPIDTPRFNAFKALPIGGHPYILGFNEPDFQGYGSSGLIPTADAAAGWDQYIAPHGAAGSLLVSPSMATQKDETWLAPFRANIKRDWDITAVHIFQNNIAGVKGDLDHFATYGKPMMITEFACINYQVSPTVYCTQAQTSAFLKQVVDLFESDSRVVAYSVSDAANGPYGSLTDNHGHLTATGQAYLSAIKPYAGANTVKSSSLSQR